MVIMEKIFVVERTESLRLNCERAHGDRILSQRACDLTGAIRDRQLPSAVIRTTLERRGLRRVECRCVAGTLSAVC